MRPPTHRSGTVTNNDYPASALRLRAEGTSVVRLEVAADGRVIGCTVIGSSGNSALDSTACSVAWRRFRFTPATDAEGHLTASYYTHSVNWRLPAETPLSPGGELASD
ncbi:MAG TPA: energy transducer TonB [Allosphingosinicella sp.]